MRPGPGRRIGDRSALPRLDRPGQDLPPEAVPSRPQWPESAGAELSVLARDLTRFRRDAARSAERPMWTRVPPGQFTGLTHRPPQEHNPAAELPGALGETSCVGRDDAPLERGIGMGPGGCPLQVG